MYPFIVLIIQGKLEFFNLSIEKSVCLWVRNERTFTFSRKQEGKQQARCKLQDAPVA
jgi:hypothetical protein